MNNAKKANCLRATIRVCRDSEIKQQKNQRAHETHTDAETHRQTIGKDRTT